MAHKDQAERSSSSSGQFAPLPDEMSDVESDCSVSSVISSGCVAHLNSEERISKGKKRLSQSPPLSPIKESSKRPNTGSEYQSSQSIALEPASTFIITAKQGKVSYNFVPAVLKPSDLSSIIDFTSLKLIGQSAALQGSFLKNANLSLYSFPFEIIHPTGTFICKLPKKYSNSMGEIWLPLSSIGDRSPLAMQNSELKQMLQLPSCSGTTLLGVERVFPRQVFEDPSSEDAKKFHTLRIALEFTTTVPEKIFFQGLAMSVSNYHRPPIRCFNCQRYGHGALACRRRVCCARCAESHQTADCTSPERKCISCKGNHPASSVRCAVFKLALKIASAEQNGSIPRDEASKRYASLYAPGVSHPRQPAPSIHPSPTTPPESQPTSLHTHLSQDESQTQSSFAAVAKSSGSRSTRSSQSETIPPNQEFLEKRPKRHQPSQKSPRKHVGNSQFLSLPSVPSQHTHNDSTDYSSDDSSNSQIPANQQQYRKRNSSNQPPSQNNDDSMTLNEVIASLINKVASYIINLLSSFLDSSSPIITPILKCLLSTLK